MWLNILVEEWGELTVFGGRFLFRVGRLSDDYIVSYMIYSIISVNIEKVE